MKNQLEIYRKQIDQIDNQILKLMGKRLGVCKKIGDYKKRTNLKIKDSKREKLIFKKIEKKCSLLNLDKKYINAIYKLILKNSRENQR